MRLRTQFTKVYKEVWANTKKIKKSVLDMTCREAGEYIALGINNPKKRTICPACRRSVKSYSIQICRADVDVLMELYTISRCTRKEWVNVNQKIKPTSRSYSSSRRWGLIEKYEINPNNMTSAMRRNRGRWRLTKKGQDFLMGKISIPKVLIMYDQNIKRIDDSVWVTVFDCYQEKFNFAEVFNSTLVSLFKYPSKRRQPEL